jgi:mitogen-activated protein kinase 15
LLKVIPEERITADEAIRHPYVAKFYNPSLEGNVQKRDVLPPLNDDVQLSIDQYRQKLYEIIQKDKSR